MSFIARANIYPLPTTRCSSMRAVHTDCLEAHRARSEQAVTGSLDLRGLCCETQLAGCVEIFPYFYLHNSLLGKELLATSIAIKYLNLLYIRLSSQFTFTFREFFCICQSLQPGPRNTNTAESLYPKLTNLLAHA